MPRKSAAALSVVPPVSPLPPEPPEDLTPAQAKIWRTIVKCRPPQYFDGACFELLRCYCQHADAANVIARQIQQTDENDLKRYSKLLGMACRETNALMSLSAKLRLAPQHVRRVEQVLPRQPHRPRGSGFPDHHRGKRFAWRSRETRPPWHSHATPRLKVW
jgi:hypothetical protein